MRHINLPENSNCWKHSNFRNYSVSPRIHWKLLFVIWFKEIHNILSLIVSTSYTIVKKFGSHKNLPFLCFHDGELLCDRSLPTKTTAAAIVYNLHTSGAPLKQLEYWILIVNVILARGSVKKTCFHNISVPMKHRKWSPKCGKSRIYCNAESPWICFSPISK